MLELRTVPNRVGPGMIKYCLSQMADIKSLVVCTALAAMLFGCSGGDADKPYLEFAGGGFIYNYRLATADYGFVVRRVKKIPQGTIIEAEFENPSGGPPIVIQQLAQSTRLSYKFETPPVTGIKANTDYQVEVRLIDPSSHEVFARYSKLFHADVDQIVLPEKPPVVGPGHQPNPEAR